MKKIKLVTAILLALLVVAPVNAAQKKKNNRSHKTSYSQKNKKKSSSTKSTTTSMTDEEIRHYNARRFDIHNVYVWGGAGYSGLVNKGTSWTNGFNYVGTGSSKFVGGGGGILGVGYEYNYKRLILSVGPEFRIFSSLDKITLNNPVQIDHINAYDQTKLYTLSDMQENQVVGQLTLPILAGMQLDKWYWKAGVKIGYSVMGRYTQKGNVSAALRDPVAYEDWSNSMPNHYRTGSTDINLKGTNSYGFDMALSAEIGLRLDQLLGDDWMAKNEARQYPMRMRIALFADYGLINMSIAKSDAPMVPMVDVNNLQTASWQASEWGSSKLNSLIVGVKFTWLLQLNKEKEEMSPNGYLSVFTFDARTRQSLPNTAVQISATKRGEKATKKTTNANAIFAKRYPQGDYQISAQRNGYMPVKNQRFHHIQGNDTALIAMQPIPVYKCVILDAKSNQGLASTLTFTDVATKKVVKTGQSAGATGLYSVTLPLGATYQVRVDAADHFAFTTSVSDIYGVDTFRIEPVIKKRVIVLQNLFFATNETTILPESEMGLQDLYDLLNENPEIRIRITGHTDNVGSDEANLKLSEGRAYSVRQAMIDRGIDANRIEAEGKGESEPIATNDTEEGRQQNRRVEFVIL